MKKPESTVSYWILRERARSLLTVKEFHSLLRSPEEAPTNVAFVLERSDELFKAAAKLRAFDEVLVALMNDKKSVAYIKQGLQAHLEANEASVASGPTSTKTLIDASTLLAIQELLREIERAENQPRNES